MRKRAAERGQVADSVLIFPLILGLIFLIIQVGIWAYARNLAAHAAREGASTSASYESSQSPDAITQSVLSDSADGVLHSYAVTSSRTGDSVTVTVRGKALSLIPFVELPHVEQTVTVPVEKYVP